MNRVASLMNQSTFCYSAAEEACNVATHAVGAILAIVGTFKLLLLPTPYIFPVSALIYGTSIFAFFLTSSLFHALRDSKKKDFVRKINQATIFFAIAGSCLPFLFFNEYPQERLILYCALGVVAVAGGIASFFKLKQYYCAAAICLFMIGAMLLLRPRHCPFSDSRMVYEILLLAGVVAYGIGVSLNRIQKPFMHSTFHVFILLGASIQYYTIWWLIYAVFEERWILPK